MSDQVLATNVSVAYAAWVAATAALTAATPAYQALQATVNTTLQAYVNACGASAAAGNNTR